MRARLQPRLTFGTVAFLLLAVLGPITAGRAQSASAEPPEVEPEIVELEVFQVFTSAQDLALDAKRQSDRVGSFLSADAIGILPDDDLGDALSRLAGVNVVGSEVVIRGAEGELNNIQVDGLSPSNVSEDTTLGFGEADTRRFEVDQIPTELVESVEVIKSITADLDGDSIGGLVNVKTADAFNFQERIMRYKAEYRYKELNGDPGYGLSATFADRLNKEGTMGLYLNLSLRSEDNMTSTVRTDFNPTLPDVDDDGNPQNVRRIRRIRPNATAIDRNELNFNGSFDWKLSDRTTVHLKGWYSKIDTIRLSNEVRLDEGEESWNDYDRRNTVDAELFLDDLKIDPVTNELVSIGNVVDNNEPGTFTPLGGDDTDFRQVEEFRPIRLLNNEDGSEERYRAMLAGETSFENGSLLEWVAAFDQSKFSAFSIANSWEAEAQEDTRIFRAFWDQSDPLRPNVTAILKDVPFGSGQALDDNWGKADDVRLAAWINQGYTAEEADRMLAAGITGETAPAAVDADGSLVYWWEVADQSRVQILDLINRMNFDRQNDQITLQADYTLPLTDAISLKTGAKFRNQKRTTSAVSRQWAQDFDVVAEGFGGEFTLSDFQHLGVDYPSIEINDGIYAQAAGKFIDPLLLADFQNRNFADASGRPYWQAVTPDSLRRIAAKNWEGEETITSGYMMGTWSVNPNFTLIGGLRYEYTSDDFIWRGSDVDPPLPFDPVTGELLGNVSLPRAVDRRAENSYGNLLPSALAVYRIGDHVFRAAVSETVARPDFDDLNPLDINQLFQVWGEFFGTPDADIFIHNPTLEEQTSLNFDLAWEWYYDDGSLLSVTLFQKRLKNFHLDQTVTRPDVSFPVLDEDTGLQEIDGDGNPVFDTEDQDIKFAANGADRKLEGVEVSFQQSFRKLLPSPFDGLGVLVNYTYLSGTETNTLFDPDALLAGEFVPIGEMESDGLSGQPEHIVNAQLYWEKWGFSTRIAYNYVSEYDREVFSPDRDEITGSRGQLDASIQYFLPERWFGGHRMRVFAEGRNLNREGEQEYDQIPRWTTYVNAPQREFVFGIRGEF